MARKRLGPAAAIRQLDAHFMSAAASHDAKALVTGFYATDAVVMPPNSPLVKGRVNIQKFWQGLLDAGAFGVKLKTSTVEAAGDLAYGRGGYSFSMPAADGSASQSIGKYVVVYRRQKTGGWLAIADIFNSDTPSA
jgi:ketosteroid isomerase-like protein